MSVASELLDNYEPLFDFLLMRVIPPGCVEGEIAIPEGAEDHPIVCRVLRVGPGRESDIVPGKRMEMPVGVDDLVVLNPEQKPYLSAKDYYNKEVGWLVIVRATSMFCMGKAFHMPGGIAESRMPSPADP